MRWIISSGRASKSGGGILSYGDVGGDHMHRCATSGEVLAFWGLVPHKAGAPMGQAGGAVRIDEGAQMESAGEDVCAGAGWLTG